MTWVATVTLREIQTGTGTEAPGLCLARECNQPLHSVAGQFSSLLPDTVSLELFKSLSSQPFPSIENCSQVLWMKLIKPKRALGEGKGRVETLRSRSGNPCKPLTVPPLATPAGWFSAFLGRHEAWRCTSVSQWPHSIHVATQGSQTQQVARSLKSG